jgi:hypothetical protein
MLTRRIKSRNVGGVFPGTSVCDAAPVKYRFTDVSLADLATKSDDSISIVGEALQLSEPPALAEHGRKYPTHANEAARLLRH